MHSVDALTLSQVERRELSDRWNWKWHIASGFSRFLTAAEYVILHSVFLPFLRLKLSFYRCGMRIFMIDFHWDGGEVAASVKGIPCESEGS